VNWLPLSVKTLEVFTGAAFSRMRRKCVLLRSLWSA